MAKKKRALYDSKSNWIQGAIKKPGSFTKQAKAKGLTVPEFISEVASNPDKYSPKTRKRAALAKTLKKLAK